MPTIKKIALIEPEPPGLHVFSSFRMPRLGLPLLGAILKKNGYDVTIHVGALSDAYIKEFSQSDLIAISTTTSTAIEAYRIADLFRALGKTVVIGGVHATFLHDEALGHADYVVRGEGENVFPELIRHIADETLPKGLQGVSFSDGEEIIHNPVAPLIDDLDTLPFPDFSLLNDSLKLFNTPVQTSRGCPYPCNFCNVTQMFGRKMRYRSVDHVIAELSQLPSEEIFFYDDNFCANPKRTKDLCEAMAQKSIKSKRGSAQVRADMTRDRELVQLMKSVGINQVYVGFESINPDSLEYFDKKQTVEEIAQAMEVFRQFKIHVHGMFVMGAEHDTEKTAQDTLKFARKHRIDTVQFMMLCPLPGTMLADQLDTEGRILTKDWSLYDAHHAVYIPKKMSAETLQTSTILAMQRFYSLWDGVLKLSKGDWYNAVRRAMGWYLIRNWKKDNKGWDAHLRQLNTGKYQAIIDQYLVEAKKQIDELREKFKTKNPVLNARLDDLRNTIEAYGKEVARISSELRSGIETDLPKLQKRAEQVLQSAENAVNEFRRLSQRINKQAI
ncbi:radical SAM protein [bacterium]|nr:radical SAM protein [bacterium]